MKPRAVAPRCTRKHPRLTKNRHVNEHLSFCALHAKAARNSRMSAAAKKAHEEAFRAHLIQAARHFRTLRAR